MYFSWRNFIVEMLLKYGTMCMFEHLPSATKGTIGTVRIISDNGYKIRTMYSCSSRGLHCLLRPVCPKTLDHHGRSVA